MNKNEIALNTLKNIIGSSLFSEVCEKMSGCSLYIPSSSRNKEERNKEIRFDFYSGLNYLQIAKKYNLSLSQIYKIIESRK